MAKKRRCTIAGITVLLTVKNAPHPPDSVFCLIFRQPEPAHNIEFGYDADKTVSLVAIINKKETFYEEKIKTFVRFFFTKKRILRFGRPNLIIDPNQQSTILININ